MRSLLPWIKKMQDDSTYQYAIKLFDEKDRLNKEADKIDERIYVVNRILGRMIQQTVNVEDGEY